MVDKKSTKKSTKKSKPISKDDREILIKRLEDLKVKLNKRQPNLEITTRIARIDFDIEDLRKTEEVIKIL